MEKLINFKNYLNNLGNIIYKKLLYEYLNYLKDLINIKKILLYFCIEPCF